MAPAGGGILVVGRVSSGLFHRTKGTPLLDPIARAAVVATGLSALLAASSSPALGAEAPRSGLVAVVNGATDPGDSAVVSLSRDHQLKCSGVLIAPAVVLTAAHCLLHEGNLVLPDVQLADTFSPDQPTVPGRGGWVHPLYDELTLANDIALLFLPSPMPPDLQPFSLPAADAPDPDRGRTVEVIGFGVGIKTDGAITGAGVRRKGTAEVTGVADSWLLLKPAPALPCAGDSGGPVVSDGTVLGVVSQGDLACHTLEKAIRVKAFIPLLTPVLAAENASARDDGQLCHQDEQCRSGRCIPATDDPLVRFCSRACGQSGDCPSPMACGADQLCRFAGRSPGSFGAACQRDGDCANLLCSSDGVAPGVCTAICFPNARPCPAGFSCADHRSGRGPFACLPGSGEGGDVDPGVTPKAPEGTRSAGGCSSAGGAPASWVGCLPGGLLALALRLRTFRRGRDRVAIGRRAPAR